MTTRREPIVILWICRNGKLHQHVLRLPRLQAVAAVLSLMFRDSRTVGRA